MCSFAEQTFVDPRLWAGCRAWCWGYSVEEGVFLARELQCWRRLVISRCRRYSPQVKDADRATGPVRGAERESWEGFTGGTGIGLGVWQSQRERLGLWAGAHLSGHMGFLAFCFP